MITTYHYRIKDSGKANRVLSKMSRSVNMVWNFCKQTQQEALKNKSVKLIDDDKEIGIDIGIKTLATCSNGEKIERPNLRKNALAKMRYLKR
ncbi:transposase [Silvanigrella aquatica]|uniref:Transposase n=1 Tax=Silvanigrella aquatica TaxID=1915309 RepID=A0A1L4D250_9BACT|nr:transposase [Silvanigrella aquatica]APJ04285.1 hypothetical protein AXG55_10355 [Silvanigrella aquatica]